MKVLFQGLGSIGKRHLQNLHAACAAEGIAAEVTALRHSDAPLQEELAPQVARCVQSLPESERFDMAFITNPTNLHREALFALKGRVGTFFIEKPLFAETGHDLAALGLGEGQKAYVAAPMRWCGVYMALKAQLAGMKPYSVRAICSSYLPGWRPDADYREVYSAKRDMGGGVTLDLIHEWDYLCDLFGAPKQVFNMRGTFSHLEIDSDDLSAYIARWPGFLGEVHLDYFGRTYRREAEIFTETGTVIADFGSGKLTLPDGSVEDYTEPVNKRYEREMAYFLEYALHGAGGSINSPQQAYKTLQITLGEME